MIGLFQVLPLSVERGNEERLDRRLKSFQETYMFPKKGEDGLLSAQPDSRSSPTAGVNARIWVQLLGPQECWTCTRRGCSPRSVDDQTVNHVWVGLLYRITGSPKVLGKGL